MGQTLTLSGELFDRLRRAAGERGLSIEQFLAQWTEDLAPAGDGQVLTPDEELLVTCTRALLAGGEPPIAADWAEIEEALQGSEPAYATVEEAMSGLRNRSWTTP